MRTTLVVIGVLAVLPAVLSSCGGTTTTTVGPSGASGPTGVSGPTGAPSAVEAVVKDGASNFFPQQQVVSVTCGPKVGFNQQGDIYPCSLIEKDGFTTQPSQWIVTTNPPSGKPVFAQPAGGGG